MQDRTGLAPRQMLLLVKDKDFPLGLKYHHINKWLSGDITQAPQSHVDFVLAVWRSVPMAEYIVEITDKTRQNLLDYRNLTGVGPRLLLRGRRSDVPPGLTANEITKWLCGITTKTQQKKIDYVLRLWAECNDLVDVGEEFRQQLIAEKARTRTGTRKLLAHAVDKPDKLTPLTIDNWIGKTARRARLDHMHYVLQRWRSFPDR